MGVTEGCDGCGRGVAVTDGCEGGGDGLERGSTVGFDGCCGCGVGRVVVAAS
jgi:hypothetical protein